MNPSADPPPVRHAVEQWVLAQSLRVALEKWAANQDRFFIARDADGYRIVRSQEPRYLAYDPPRIDSCLQILADLRLVTRHGGGYMTTQTGETLRNDALNFHKDRLGVA
ncbi:MAG TPA: hypothetical protein VJL31_11450 [Gemmatimonadales bacterium]|nr:hypothetical protein [Gemmatimonadales bacterium]